MTNPTYNQSISNGQASFNIDTDGMNSGKHIMKMEYSDSNGIYNPSTTCATLVLQKQETHITLLQNITGIINDSVNLSAEVLDKTNQPLDNGKIRWAITKLFFNPNKLYKGVVNNNDVLVVSDTSGNTYEWELEAGDYLENDELFVVILEDNVQSLEISESNVTLTNPIPLYVTSVQEVEGLYGYIIDNNYEYYDTIHDSFYSQENIMLWDGTAQTQYIVEPEYEN